MRQVPIARLMSGEEGYLAYPQGSVRPIGISSQYDKYHRSYSARMWGGLFKRGLFGKKPQESQNFRSWSLDATSENGKVARRRITIQSFVDNDSLGIMLD